MADPNDNQGKRTTPGETADAIREAGKWFALICAAILAYYAVAYFFRHELWRLWLGW